MGKECLLPGLVFIPMLGAAAYAFAGRRSERFKNRLLLGITGSVFAACLLAAVMLLGGGGPLGEGAAGVKMSALSFRIPGFASLGIGFAWDGFRSVYSVLTSFCFLAAALLSVEYMEHHRHKDRYYIFFLLTYGAVMGVFLAADFYTLFLFFEMLSLTSYVWVVQEEKADAMRAGATYLGIGIIGGLVMLMGLFLYVDAVGTAEFAMFNSHLPDRDFAFAAHEKQLRIAGLCMAVGFGAKAGAFPLHIWLPKAHPVAPAPASALLSGILTKCGVLGLLILTCRLFGWRGAMEAGYWRGWGVLMLVIGVLTMLTGAVLALAAIDLKRTLACSSVSQIGFIVIGIGMLQLSGAENALAMQGTMLYMVNHSLFKLVLFLAAGVVVMNTHELLLDEIAGFGRKKPLLQFSFLMGLLGISGVPLWSGYIGKTLLHESIAEYCLRAAADTALQPGAADMRVVEWLFIIGGAMTFAYMLKLYVCLFHRRNRDAGTQARYDAMSGHYIKPAGAVGLTAGAVLLPLFGMLPKWTMDPLARLSQDFFYDGAHFAAVSYFSWENLRGAAVSLLIGAGIYLVIVGGVMYRKGSYHNLWPSLVDLENLIYRPVLLTLLPVIGCSICRVLDRLVDDIVLLLRRTVYRDSPIPHEREEGTPVTHVLGALMDDWVGVMNYTVYRKNPHKKTFEHKLAAWQEMLAENNVIIGRSLSFGLLMFILGLVATLIYMLMRQYP